MQKKKQYSVLRASKPNDTRDPFKGVVSFDAHMTSAAADVQADISLHDLNTRDLDLLSRDASVAAIAPVMPIALVAPVAAPMASDEVWGVGAVRADISAFDGSGVMVAILDTGIASQHAAFQGIELNQKDFSGSGNGDVQGHGTHCAGTIFGRDVGGKRIGIARGVRRALIGKVLGDDGSGTSTALFSAMQWAIDSGAKVISMSLGFDFPGLVAALSQEFPTAVATSQALEAYRANLRMFDAIMGLAQARIPIDGGTIVVAASGNESNRPQYEINVSVPAAANDVVAVGALERRHEGFAIANFSNTLPTISAPGVDILSAKAGGALASLSGTSMATPHVAGVTALWWQAVSAQGGIVNARNVLAKVLASATVSGFAAGGDAADRGVGIVQAP